MSRGNRQQRGPQGPAQGSGRAPLHPADPLPGWKALMQAAVLLGLPLTLLFVARLVLRKFFPSLGY